MQSLNIGQTISRASGLMGETLRSVGLFVVVFQMITGVSSTLLRGQLVSAVDAGAAAPLAMFQSGSYWATIAISMLLATLVATGATFGLLKADRGELVSFGACAARGTARLLPALGLMILSVLGIYGGFILLLVPGCILLAMWSVCFPVLLGEDTGVIEAFGRSCALTKGYRWKIFLLFLVIFAVYAAVGAARVLVLTAQTGSLAAAISPPLTLQIASGAINTVLTLATLALQVALYGELIDLKGERVSEVFG